MPWRPLTSVYHLSVLANKPSHFWKCLCQYNVTISSYSPCIVTENTAANSITCIWMSEWFGWRRRNYLTICLQRLQIWTHSLCYNIVVGTVKATSIQFTLPCTSHTVFCGLSFNKSVWFDLLEVWHESPCEEKFIYRLTAGFSFTLYSSCWMYVGLASVALSVYWSRTSFL